MRETFGGVGAAVHVEYLPAIDVPGLNQLAATLASSRWLRERGGWDIAIVYNLGPRQVRAAEWLRQKEIPVVFEYEDDAAATVQGGAGANSRGISWIGRARRAGNGVIAVHEALRLQIGLDNADVIEGVVANELFEFSVRPFQPGLPLRVLYAGGLSSQKGVDLMLEAVETIDFPIEVTITGSGPLANQVSKAASHDHRIRFLGEVSRDVLHDELGRSHVCLNPHRVPDGHTAIVFPFKIAEYAASGAVVVSSAMQETPSQLRESMVTYESETPLTLARALSYAATHYDELCVRAQAGRDYVRNHLSMSAVGGRVEAILDEAIRASPSEGA
jgi:glycosyltransferase involved in cell wall biosynthesis